MLVKNFIMEHKTIMILGTIILALVCLNLYMLYLLNESDEEIEPIIETKEEEKEVLLKIDIKGEVLNPGLYEMNKNSRVMDVINKAGGLTKKADTSVINLSKKIKDEMVIIVYSASEVEKLKEKEEIVCPEVNDACVGEEALEPLIEESQKNESVSSTNQKININTATKEELLTLSGIGESKATAIIEYRTKQKFTKIDEIKNVSGIGEALYEKIKDNITV